MKFSAPSHVLVLDWCQTCSEAITIAHTDARLLDAQGNAEMLALRAKYLPGLEAGTATHADMAAWMQRTFAIYVEHKVTRPAIHQAMRDFVLREGVVEVLQEAKIRDVPVAIISGSCADFIEIALEMKGLLHLVSEVISARLAYNGDVVVGTVPGTIITAFNKGESARAFADSFHVPYENIIGIGDSMNDADLVGDQAARCGTPATRCGKLFGIANNEDRAKLIRHHFDHVEIGTTLHPLLPHLQRALSVSHSRA